MQRRRKMVGGYYRKRFTFLRCFPNALRHSTKMRPWLAVFLFATVVCKKCPFAPINKCIDAFQFTHGLTYGSFKIVGSCPFPLLLVFENNLCRQMFQSFAWKGPGPCIKGSLPGIDVDGFSFVSRENFFVRVNCSQE